MTPDKHPTTPAMDEQAVLRAVYLTGRENGAGAGRDALPDCSPERARRVLDAIETCDADILWDEVPLLVGITDADEWPSLNQSYEPSPGFLALLEAGLAAYDGIAEDGDLDHAYTEGYREGAEAAVAEAARRALNLEP
jgi:hypothetical protein